MTDHSQEVLDELRHYSPEEPAYLARINLALVYAVRELTAEVRAGREAREPELIELTHGSSDQSDDLADEHTQYGEPLPGTPDDEPGDDGGLAGLARDIADVTGTDYGTAEWLAGRVFQTLTVMRRESLGRPGGLEDDPSEDDPAAWACLHEREGQEPGEPEDDADYEIVRPDTIQEAASPDA